jgi:hypothetical protein
MLGGLATFALAVAGWAAAWALGWPSPVDSWRRFAAVAGVWVACAATAFANPYGATMPRTWFEIMESPILARIIVEHRPPELGDPAAWTIFGFAAVYLFVLAGTLPGRPRISWLLPLVWLVLAATRVRHAPLFSVAVLVAVADMFPHTRWARHLVRTGSDLFVPPVDGPRRRAWLAWVVPAAAVGIALALQAGRVVVPAVGHGWARLDPRYWPVELLDDLKAAERESPPGVRTFNEYVLGGFLIYHTPGLPVFVDDRCELYGDRWLAEYVDAQNRREGESDEQWRGRIAERMEEWGRRYGPFDLAVTLTGSGFDRWFQRDPGTWSAVHRTGAATLYRSTTPSERSLRLVPE